MNFKRRFVLKGVSLSGIAGLALTNSSQALRNAVFEQGSGLDPVLALVSGSAEESSFTQGAWAAVGERLLVQQMSHDLELILQLEKQMRTGRTLRIIGLLDDAAATLVVDMARGAGGRVLWLGQHNVTAGFSTHRVRTNEISAASASQFGYHLLASGAGFNLHEERLNGMIAPRRMSGIQSLSDQSAQWMTSLGYLLAAPGTPTVPLDSFTSIGNLPLTGSFVSFSIDLGRSLRNG